MVGLLSRSGRRVSTAANLSIVSSPADASGTARSVPLWRNERALRIVLQILFVGTVALAAGFLYANMVRGLQRLGLAIDFGFIGEESGFGISEGLEYEPSDPYGRAFVVGLFNTLRVSAIGIVAATLIGGLIGIIGLSGNWLVRSMARAYVEIFRNVPLLLQVIFWYSAVVLQLPSVRESISIRDLVFISQRGVYIPKPLPTDALGVWLAVVGAGFAAAVAVMLRLRAMRPRRVAPVWTVVLGLTIVVGAGVAGRILAPGAPFELETPVLERFNFAGGIRLTPEFTALLLGLTAYTSAFIAEIVRGGIQSVDRGQREAARAVGLREPQILRLVIIPQALRIVIPPVTSQYLNLAKNSSLAIAVGFPDLFNVGTTIMNQTGQSIPVFAMIMTTYLIMSILTSSMMNWYNHRVRIIER